jgi:predicted RNA binding protein YcfA (HicA-like mRNA interferase family)
MSGLPVLKPQELFRILEKLGFVRQRQKGSHVFFEHSDGRTTLVSMHKGEDIGRGLLRRILREIEMSPEEFIKFLR